MFLLIFLLIITGCGKNREIEVQELAASFATHSGITNVCVLTFNDEMPDDIAGLSTINNPNCHVKLNPRWWSLYTPLQKEGLIFHELGHGLMNRGHEETGYLHPQIHSDKTYRENRDSWLKTFFLHN